MRRILSVFVLLALAGVAANTHAGFKIELPGPFVAPDVLLVSAEFGIVKKAEDGTIQILPAKSIPLVPGQLFGWRLRFHTKREMLALREELVLPAAPKEWSSDDGDPAYKISPDGKTATTEAEVVMDDGIIQNMWSVADGDPSGDYEIRLFIEGKLVRTFKFKVEPPK
jgi:hypothetical protein